MITISLENLQAVKYAELTIEEFSIVEFTGDNSNGKSILSKVLKELLSGGLSHKENRESLIRDGENEGCLTIMWRQKGLVLFVNRQSSGTRLVYSPDVNDFDNNAIVRFLNEGGWDKLLFDFGFRIYSKGEMCLQLSPTYGSIPFVTTTGATNYEIVNDITVDRIAEEFLSTYKSITYPLLQSRHKNLVAKRDNLAGVLSTMVDYDYALNHEYLEKFTNALNAIGSYEFHELEGYKVPPKITIIPVGTHLLSEYPLMVFTPPASYLEGYDDILKNINDIRNNKCPTCGRKFF